MRKLIDLDTAIDAVIKESNADGAYGYMDTKSIVDLLNDLPFAQPESNCLGCKHAGMWEDEVEYGYPSPCTRCKRRANDHYEQ